MESMLEAARLVAGAERLVVFTGAGMSAESGVPTFRDALTGLWARFDAEALATPEAYDRDPALVWGWYEWRRELVERVTPNAGHQAVAALDCTVITQNVDDLHERAGSKNVNHLHGSLFAPRCSSCGEPFAGKSGAREPGTREPGAREPGARESGAREPGAREPGTSELGTNEPAPGTREPASGDDGRRTPPACARCQGLVRPGVVWFSEQLPADAFERAVEAAANCDVLITVGTSGLVYPAAELPQVTARMGGAVIQVNPHTTPLDPFCAVNVRGSAAQVLPRLVP